MTMRFTDRYLATHLAKDPELLKFINNQRDELHKQVTKNSRLLEFERLWKEQREMVREKDKVIAKLKKRIEMLTKCNLTEDLNDENPRLDKSKG